MEKKVSKTKKVFMSSIATLVLGTTFMAGGHVADAKYYDMNFKDSNIRATAMDYADGFKIGSKYPASRYVTKKVYHPKKKSPYEGIGKLTTDKTGKKNGGGTAFVIDDYTIVTAAHVVSDSKGKPKSPKNYHFFPSKDGNKVPYRFTIKDIKKAPGVDVAVLHTNKKVGSYVKPVGIAYESTVNRMKGGSIVNMAGYPKINGKNHNMIWSKGRYLKQTSDNVEYMAKIYRASGNSGSPLMTRDYDVVGVHAHGIHPLIKTNASEQPVNTGGALLKGKTRDFVMKNKR